MKCKCGEILDAYGDHVQSCKRLSGYRIHRHDGMAALWREIMLRSSGHDTTREDESLLRAVQRLNPRRGAAGAGEDPQETGSRPNGHLHLPRGYTGVIGRYKA